MCDKGDRAKQVSRLEDSLRDEYEERSAIMQFDGKMSKDDAEKNALALVSPYNNTK